MAVTSNERKQEKRDTETGKTLIEWVRKTELRQYSQAKNGRTG